jgi:hypothetical protein
LLVGAGARARSGRVVAEWESTVQRTHAGAIVRPFARLSRPLGPEAVDSWVRPSQSPVPSSRLAMNT